MEDRGEGDAGAAGGGDPGASVEGDTVVGLVVGVRKPGGAEVNAGSACGTGKTLWALYSCWAGDALWTGGARRACCAGSTSGARETASGENGPERRVGVGRVAVIVCGE